MGSESRIRGLYYITHINNVPSILENGILSHVLIEKRGLSYTPIYNAEVVNRRNSILTPNKKSLWEFANLYFQPRNPMLYQVRDPRNNKLEDITIIQVKPEILDRAGVYITTGNAASSDSSILPMSEGLKLINSSEMKKVLNEEYWRTEDGSKRKIMAECIVPDRIPPDLIQTIFVANDNGRKKLRELLEKKEVLISVDSYMFFQPLSRTKIAVNISLIDGDMFFSNQQTLTISVNTKGIMGKGLASRAKYQFPDVYVRYQDACKQKKLQMGKPYLYKREASLDLELADEPSILERPNDNKWFLLFPTKNHWSENSDIDGIEKGLEWLLKNYEKEEIKSLAVPALGCGLGNLEWKDIGPLMCKYLAQMHIQSSIYLPQETAIPQEYKTSEYLLKDKL